jgi:DNA-directed RNA polymerase subunit RPC12/RpoP
MKKMLIKCPKCSSKSIVLVELYECRVYVYTPDGILTEPHIMNLKPGDIIDLGAACMECEHTWKVRKALQCPGLFIDVNE